MEFIKTEELKNKIDNKEFFGEGLLDSYVVVPDKFGDERGFFTPAFIQKQLEENIPYLVLME